MIADEMIHGCLPRSGGARPRRRSGSVRGARGVREPAKPLPQPEPQGCGVWDISARSYQEMLRRCEEAGEPYRPPWRTRIEDDTFLVPHLIAELVCEEASLWLAEPFPREWVAELAESAKCGLSAQRRVPPTAAKTRECRPGLALGVHAPLAVRPAGQPPPGPLPAAARRLRRGPGIAAAARDSERDRLVGDFYGLSLSHQLRPL